jgi:hypothetical protein
LRRANIGARAGGIVMRGQLGCSPAIQIRNALFSKYTGDSLMRCLAIIALSLSLSGCWSGDGFYASSESVAAIPAGKYRVYDVRGPRSKSEEASFGERIKIKYNADGTALVEGVEAGDSANSTLVKLGTQPGLYIVQADLGAPIPKIGSSLYALVNLTPNGYQIAVPRCDQKRAAFWDRAIVSGLLVGKPFCKFSNRADFEKAMLDYAKDPISWTEYRRVKR